MTTNRSTNAEVQSYTPRCVNNKNSPSSFVIRQPVCLTDVRSAPARTTDDMTKIVRSGRGRSLLILFFSLFVITLGHFSSAVAQGLGNVTAVARQDDALLLSVGSDVVVFRACTDRILMVNFRPNGLEDPDTLVVATTVWAPGSAVVDTSGPTLYISTSAYRVEIDRSPLRFRFFLPHPAGEYEACGEPFGGGLSQNAVTLETSGGTFYGVHNRPQGSLATSTGGSVFAGNQGQAGGPFAWTTEGWGFLADTDGGELSLMPTSISFSRPSSPAKRDLEFYLIAGTPKEIIRGLHEITGFPPLFPKYTLGFMNTEWGLDQTELYADILTYRAKSIPIDAFVLDFDWMDWGADNYGEFRWGPKFPGGPTGALVDTLTRYSMHLMGIRKPRIHVNTVQGQFAQSQGYFESYTTDYFSGQSVGRLNFHKPAVRSWYWDSFISIGNSFDRGITGYWNDEADEYGGNLMFMQMQRAQYEGQRSINNRRVWSINRNFYTGAQRYAYALWSGDIQTGFAAMADQRLFMLSSLTLGVSWWGMDIGGFQSSPSPENYFRWIQFGAFVPVFRVHGSLNQEREPWYYGAEAESIATRYIRLRYKLLPYISSAAWENHRTGIPIARPLVYEFPDDVYGSSLTSEWMFGPNLLVSPVVSQGATQQSVYLPAGVWYDFHTGQSYAGAATYPVTVTHADIPLFVKAGSLVPMSLPAQFVDAPEMRSATVLASYPGGNGTTSVYDDDGLTYDYELGQYATTDIDHRRTARRTDIVVHARTGPYPVGSRDWLAELVWVADSPDSVVLDSVRLSSRSLDSIRTYSIVGWSHDPVARACVVRFPDDGGAHSLSVYFPDTTTNASPGSGGIPHRYELEQNYPNPFNPGTSFRFALPKAEVVLLAIFDVLGRRVATLVDEMRSVGTHVVYWNAEGIPSGVYFAQFESGVFRGVMKVLLMR